MPVERSVGAELRRGGDAAVALAQQWAAEKGKLMTSEAELKWERDFLLGKLLEKEVRHDVHVERLQDQLALLFKEYRRHFDEQKARIESSCRALVEEAVHDTIFVSQQKAQLEEKVKRLMGV